MPVPVPVSVERGVRSVSDPCDRPDDATEGRLPLPAELSPRMRRSRQGVPRTGASQGGGGAYRPRGRRAARFASWLAVTASVLVLVLSGAAFAYYEHLDGNIHRVPVFNRITGSRPSTAVDGAQNILVVGSDSRSGQTAAQLAQEHTTQDGGALNTDTIIVLHLAPNGGPATLISIPRDSYVPIPGHGTFKINSAYADGEADRPGNGPALLTQTVEDLTGLHIDHFITVGFSQFIDISNAIGGVNVCVVNPAVQGHGQYDGGAYDPYSGTKLSRGVHTISGPTALAFVRQRHNLPGGDLDRIHRQQRFITAIEKKASQTTNPLTINAVLEQATKSLTVDSGLSGTALAALALRLKALKPADIRFATVPIADPAAMSPSGVSYVQLDMTKLTTFFANVRAERDPNAAPPVTPAPSASSLSPAEVTLTVQNGSGVTGGAAKARSELSGYGYQVSSVGTTTQTASTTIRYDPADAAAAAELKKAVPSAQLVSDASVTAGTVELVLGGDYGGTRDPATAPSSSPTVPTPTSTGPAKGTTTAGSLVAGMSIDGVPCGP